VLTYNEAKEHGVCGQSEAFASDFARFACRLSNGTGSALCPSTVNTAVCITQDGEALTSGQLLELGKIIGSKNIVDVPLLATDALLNEKPTSGIIYAQEMFDRVTNPGKVYAQSATPYYPGLGFNLLSPIRSIWGWSTTFVYSFMIIIILGIAFSLLFQNALSGKQVVQLSTAIPNVVIAMVLIPLSYPIAGFAIDFMALGANLVHGVMLSGNTAIASQFYSTNNIKITGGALGAFTLFGARPGDEPISNTSNRGLYIDDPRISVWRAFTLIDVSELGSIIGGGCDPAAATASGASCPGIRGNVCAIGAIQSLTEAADAGDTRAAGILNQIKTAPDLNAITAIIESSGVNDNRGAGCTVLTVVDAVLSLISTVVQAFGGASGVSIYTIDNLLGDILYIILTFAAFFTTFRIFIALFVKYVSYFLLMPMISPFLFASVAIPGQGTKGVMFMLKRMYGTAVVFIAVYSAFLLAIILSQGNVLQVDGAVANKFVPPLLGLGGSSPIATSTTNIGLNFEGILDLAAMGIFFAIPSLIKYLDDLFGLQIEVPGAIKASVGGIGAGVALGSAFTRRTVGAARSTLESAGAVREKARNLDARLRQENVRRADQRILRNQGIGAVTKTQQLDNMYKKNLRQLANDRERIANDATMPTALRALRLANIDRQIAAEQRRAKANLGSEINNVLTKKLSATFVGPGAIKGTNTGFRTNINSLNDPGKVIFTADTQDANRIFGIVGFSDKQPGTTALPLVSKLRVYFGGDTTPKKFDEQYGKAMKMSFSTKYSDPTDGPKDLRADLWAEVQFNEASLDSKLQFDFGPSGKASGEGGSELPFRLELSPLAQSIIQLAKIDMTFNADEKGAQFKYTFIFQPPGSSPSVVPTNLGITINGRSSATFGAP
jgi:hypothetical protein